MSRSSVLPERATLRRALLSLLAGAVGLAVPLCASHPAVADPGTAPAAPASAATSPAGSTDASMVTLKIPAVSGAAAAGRPSGSNQLRAAVRPSPTQTSSQAAASAAPVVVAELPAEHTKPFGLVGVTWAEDSSSQDLQVQVRTLTGDTWSTWQGVDIDQDGPTEPGAPQSDAASDQAAAPRAGTVPTWVGDADGVSVRVLSSSGTAPPDLRIALIDGGTGLAAPAPAGPATAAPAAARTVTTASTQSATATTTAKTATTASAGIPAMPTIVTRKQWGVDTSTEISCSSPRTASTMKGVVLHHTAGGNNYTRAQAPGIVRGIHLYHTKSRGWCDMGYNFLVDKYGVIYEGRRGGITKQVRGAHAGNWDVNLYTTGISMMGNFETVAVPKALKNSVVKLMAWRLASFGHGATGNITFDGKKLPRISGHRDVYLKGIRPATATACPGKYAYAWLNGGLRSQVQQVIDAAKGSPPASVSRIAGPDRYGTAAAAAQATFTGPVDSVFLASGEDFPDALSAGPAAGVNGPVLLARQDSLPPATVTALKSLQPSTIYILGDQGALSAVVANQAATYAPTVTRLSGSDRYETGAAVARTFWPDGTDTVYLASGLAFPDALSGGTLAARDGAPILLARTDRLPTASAAELTGLHPSKVVLIGGESVLDAQVEQQVTQALPDATVSRIQGPDRFATSAAVVKAGWASATTAYFAAGSNFPDALAGVPTATMSGAPLLLARATCLPPTVFDEAAGLGLKKRVLLGGTTVLENSASTTRCAS